MKYKAALFDVDGTLINSESHNLMAAVELFKRHGVKVNRDDFAPFIGGGADKYIGGVAKKYNIEFENADAAKAELYAIYDVIIKGNIPVVKGALELIAKCKAKGMKVALATSADRTKLHSNLRELGAAESDFDAVVQGLEIKHKKPHPETFLKAAAKLGLRPNDCIVFEDAPNGVTAAKEGGFTCVGVMTTFSAEQLGSANYVVPNLSKVTNEIMGF